jgi:hypothetical protein
MGTNMTIHAAELAILMAVLGAAVIYGTDVFCALVQRPAVAAVDDRALVTVIGNVHRYGDRRLPVPGVVGIVAATAAAVLSWAAGEVPMAAACAAAVGLQLIWLALYVRISAPINRQLTVAATTGTTPVDARTLQENWDRIINARAVLQGSAVVALILALVI